MMSAHIISDVTIDDADQAWMVWDTQNKTVNSYVRCNLYSRFSVIEGTYWNTF